MTDTDPKELIRKAESAIEKRKQHILSNLETVTLKSVRRLLESDLELPVGTFDAAEVKAFINTKTDEIISEEAANPTQPSADPTPVKSGPSSDAGPPAKKPAASKRSRPSDGEQATKKQKKKQAQEDKEPKGTKRKEKPKAKDEQGTKNKKDEGKSRHAEESADDLEDSEEEEAPKAREKKRRKSEPAAPAKGASKGETNKVVSKRVEQLKAICRQATIRIAPQVYMKNKDEASLIAALEDLLQKWGLRGNSDFRDIQRVKRKLLKDRDMDGINMDNIIMEEGRPRRSAAEAGRSNYRAMLQPPKLQLEDDQEDEDEESEEDEEEDEEVVLADEEEEDDDAGEGKEDVLADEEEEVDDEGEGKDDDGSDADVPDDAGRESGKKKAVGKADQKPGNVVAKTREKKTVEASKKKMVTSSKKKTVTPSKEKTVEPSKKKMVTPSKEKMEEPSKKKMVEPVQRDAGRDEQEEGDDGEGDNVDDELEDELDDEVKDELKDELEDEVKDDLEDELQDELEDDVGSGAKGGGKRKVLADESDEE